MYRVCKDCNKLLWYQDNKYTCDRCFQLFEEKETLPYGGLVHLCIFKKSLCDKGEWWTCIECGKSVFVTLKESEEMSSYRMLIFNEEYLRTKRQKLLQSIQDIRVTILTKLAKEAGAWEQVENKI